MQKNEDQQEVVHFVQARNEFNVDHNKVKFDSRKKAIKDYYNSGKYEIEVITTCNEAKDYFNKVDVSERSVVFFDIDDTALRPLIWEMDVLEINCPLTKINLPVLELYKSLIVKGFKIIFITGRNDIRYEETRKDLEQSGYLGFHDLILIPNDLFKNASTDKLGNWKYTVRQEFSKDFEIIGCVGDRDVDFAGGYTGFIVKLPNYLY